MNFQYSEEQQLLADSMARLAEQHYGFDARKHIIASEQGWCPETWSRLAELGVLAIALPAEHGGFDGGALDLVASMETIGSALMLEPFLSTVGLGARLIHRYGSADQAGTLLPQVASGELRLAFAHDEAMVRDDLTRMTTQAVASEGGWVLSGEKATVLHAPCANRLIVSARTSGEPGSSNGLSLFVVDPATPGVQMHAVRTHDNLRAADVAFEGVRLGAKALLGAAHTAFDAITEALDFATVLICAEAVGAMRSANAATLDYLKTRRQFGVTIGSFQALQHRLVDMHVSAEQARSITLLACGRVDAAARGQASAAERMRVVSAAKVKISEAGRHVGQEAIQLHGGMGMTQEMKVAHTFKRLTMIGLSLGDADHHLERFARVS